MLKVIYNYFKNLQDRKHEGFVGSLQNVNRVFSGKDSENVSGTLKLTEKSLVVFQGTHFEPDDFTQTNTLKNHVTPSYNSGGRVLSTRRHPCSSAVPAIFVPEKWAA